MVCNIHNGALLLCPAKLSRHTPYSDATGAARGHRLAAGGRKKVRLTRARTLKAWAPASAILVPRLAAAALVALGAHARVLTSCTILLSFQTIFAMQK